jgi:hypothetical protein
LKERYVTSEAAVPSDSRVRWIEYRQVIKMYRILYFIGALNYPLEENIDNFNNDCTYKRDSSRAVNREPVVISLPKNKFC